VKRGLSETGKEEKENEQERRQRKEEKQSKRRLISECRDRSR
jgi:hypothetical protein